MSMQSRKQINKPNPDNLMAPAGCHELSNVSSPDRVRPVLSRIASVHDSVASLVNGLRKAFRTLRTASEVLGDIGQITN